MNGEHSVSCDYRIFSISSLWLTKEKATWKVALWSI